jgi:pectin methylesterase-like acyl-CoA thioesterase
LSVGQDAAEFVAAGVIRKGEFRSCGTKWLITVAQRTLESFGVVGKICQTHLPKSYRIWLYCSAYLARTILAFVPFDGSCVGRIFDQERSRPMALRFSLSAATFRTSSLVAGAIALMVGSAAAQTPVLLPNTIASIAGNTPVVSTTSAACPTNAQFTATDAAGNGCPAVNAVIPSVVTGIAVDPQGNVYISANSTNPQIIRKIDARTGNITAFAGAFASQCASGSGQKIYGTKALQTDKTGDNCPVAYTSGFNGPVSLGTDPYGNLLIGTTGDAAVHFVCNAVSPLCNATQAGEQLMIAAIACDLSGGTTSYPTPVAGTTVGTAGDGTQAQNFGVTTCTTGVSARVYAPTADKWGNIYFMDGGNGRLRVVAGPASITVNGVVIPNPLYAALAISTGAGLNYSTPQQGFVYPIAGGATGGVVCGGSTDAGGDGCPFYQTLVNTGGTGSLVQGTAVDRDGDFIFDDGNGRLRVIYMGGTTIKGALAANGVASPLIGYSYALIGGVSTGAPTYYNSGNPGVILGSSTALQPGAIQTLAVDPAGNILIGDQLQVLFFDIATGYLRRLATANGAASCNANAVGDGCPFTQSKFGVANKALPIADDALGNLYILDIPDLLVRRVSTQTLPTTVVNNAANTTPLTSALTVHTPVAGSTVTITAPTTNDFVVGTTTCTTNTPGDGSVDCTAAVTYSPKLLALRTDPVSVATTANAVTTTQNIALNSTATGSALVFDTASAPATTVLGAATTGNTAVVLDGAGNAYVSGTQGISKVTGSTVTNISATPAAYLAVGATGAVYAAGSGATSITKYVYSAASNSYTSSAVAIPSINICTTTTTSVSCALTQAFSGPMTVDTYGNIYIADLTNKYVEKFNPSSGVSLQLNQTPLTSPTAMGQDSYGNLLVIDGTSVLKIPAAGLAVTATSPAANPVVTLSTPLTAPTSVTADQGENVYVADGGSIKVQPLSGGQYTIPTVAGSAVAVDGAGNLYTTSTTVAGITEVLRGAETFDFGTSIVASYVGVFGNAGATTPTGFGQTDTGGNFTGAVPASPVAASAPACNLSSTILAGGSVCNISLSFTPTPNGNGPIQDAITFLPPTNTLGSVVLNGTKTGTNASTTTSITGNTAGLIFSTGNETTFTVTITETPAAVPSGTVAVVVDGGTAVNYPLTGASSSSATATVPVSGLAAGSHTIVATYANSAGIVGSTSSTTNFSIGQAATSVSWTPGTTTLPYSAAMGTAVLNATATSPAKTGNVVGAFIYTATPSGGGTAVAIHSASYLPIGSYALNAVFVPTDSVDYAGSTGSVATFTVTRANTSAPVGSTTTLVASDGTGNFTTVQAAVDTLPAGGSVYIKPGTYSGFVTVVQPNVALRGLGGDPTKVLLTHEAGSFGSSYPYIGEFTPANSNGAQLQSGSSVFTGDEASATLVVARGINTKLSAVQQIPNGFYAENLSLINTYDTDTTTTTTTYASTSNGTCVLGQPTAMTYAALYNTGQLCASQALVIWTTADLQVMNNVYTTSLQDTIYTASPGSGSTGVVPSRQYWFRGKVTGDVDYIFGDAAAVFDNTSIYTAWHGATATGTETIEAQNKSTQTGASGDYVSGYVMNSNVFTSQSTGMTNLFLGRPYGTFSTWIMLNSYVDQTNATGYTTGLGPALTQSTYGEYNDIPYTDPATGSPDLNGVPYLGTGGNTGTGVAGPRETNSTNPGTVLSGNNPPVPMTQAQAQYYYPTNFLSQTVPAAISSTTNWNPTAALAANVNAFVPGTSVTSVTVGTPITILMRPQTPGLGATSNGNYTIPTGTYQLFDGSTLIAGGNLDAAGEAYFTSSSLSVGQHNLTWTYGGDTNFAGSTTATPLAVTVNAIPTTISLAPFSQTITYGQAVALTATVASTGNSYVPTGNVTLTIDGSATQISALVNGVATFSVTGLNVGGHTFSASYAGDGTAAASATAGNSIATVNKAVLTVTGSGTDRSFGAANLIFAAASGFQNSDTAATVFATGPTATTSATRTSPAGTYTVIPVATLSTFGSTNYTLSFVTGTFNIIGGVAQQIVFAPLPNFAHGGSYQLTARASSGLPVTYTVTAGGGIASVSGSALTVTGAGAVTVTATQTDPSTDFATATASRSFTAQ